MAQKENQGNAALSCLISVGSNSVDSVGKCPMAGNCARAKVLKSQADKIRRVLKDGAQKPEATGEQRTLMLKGTECSKNDVQLAAPLYMGADDRIRLQGKAFKSDDQQCQAL